MPIVLIIVGLAVAVGIGSYFLRPEEPATTGETELVVELPAEEPASEGPTSSDDTGGTPTQVAPTTPVVTPAPTTPAAEPAPVTITTVYADGAHAATAPYTAPNNARHNVAVTLTLKDDVVTAANVTYSGDKVETSSNYQSRFSNAYQAQVIGKKLDSIQLSRVGGASLTSNAFNAAVSQIKSSARN